MTLVKRLIQILAASLLVCASAYADSWSCRHGDDVRELHIERSSDAPVPCQVVYRKLTEGVEDQVLWNAQFEENYCAEKAAEFLTKLEGWGWTCVETIRDPATVQ